MYHVRDACDNDTNYVFDIDLKCFDAAWTPDEWREKAEKYRIQVCTYFGTPIAFILFRETEGAVEIAKVAVKAPYRLRGIASSLLDVVAKWGKARGVGRMSLLIPEYLTDPDHPNRIGGWLIASGFRGTRPFVRDAFFIDGEPEAGIIFERSI